MADTHTKARYWRVAILTLLLVLIATALGMDIFPDKGHAPSKPGTLASSGAGGGMAGGAALALLPLDADALATGAEQRPARLHTEGGADSDENSGSGFEGGDGLRNLVYRSPGGDDNKPESDGSGGGDHDWGFGGGAPGFGSGGGAFGFAGPNTGPGGGPGGLPMGAGLPQNPHGDPLLVSPDLTQALSPVPEPAAWTMLILGFGAVGFALRRARRLANSAALTPPPGPSLA